MAKLDTSKQTKTNFVSSVGRRKQAVARVRLIPGLGTVTVNGKPVEDYFVSLPAVKMYLKPFAVTQTANQYGATVLVSGGGVAAQMDALVHGIARALAKIDSDKFRPLLRQEGLLTRDARSKERRKYGLAHAARAKKQSPKR